MNFALKANFPICSGPRQTLNALPSKGNPQCFWVKTKYPLGCHSSLIPMRDWREGVATTWTRRSTMSPRITGVDQRMLNFFLVTSSCMNMFMRECASLDIGNHAWHDGGLYQVRPRVSAHICCLKTSCPKTTSKEEHITFLPSLIGMSNCGRSLDFKRRWKLPNL